MATKKTKTNKRTTKKVAPKKAATKKQAYEFTEKNPLYHVLNQVIDPELGVGIADMGLVYHAEVTKDGVGYVVFTLTSMGCPMGPELATDIDETMRKHKGVKDVDLEVVWDPPWNPDRMKPELKEMLFGWG